jgi:hypothetical protein
VFTEFKDNISRPEKTYTAEELKLMHILVVTCLYPLESQHRSEQEPILSKFLRGGGLVSVVRDMNDTKPDGSILAHVPAADVMVEILSVETKNEIGTIGSEPGFKVQWRCENRGFNLGYATYHALHSIYSTLIS